MASPGEPLGETDGLPRFTCKPKRTRAARPRSDTEELPFVEQDPRISKRLSLWRRADRSGLSDTCLRSQGSICVAAVSSFFARVSPPHDMSYQRAVPTRSPRCVPPVPPPAFFACALCPRGDLRHVSPVVLHLPLRSALSAPWRLPRPRPSRLAPPCPRTSVGAEQAGEEESSGTSPATCPASTVRSGEPPMSGHLSPAPATRSTHFLHPRSL